MTETVPVTLEQAWVLRSYGVPKADVLAALRHMQGLPDVELAVCRGVS